MYDAKKTVEILSQGGIIAYPTEAVFGLGCDPLNQNAVEKILNLKQRSVDKGLIIIAASWEQVEKYVKPIDKKLLNKALNTWPGPVTWILPASKLAPKWITGKHDSIAIRITAHPIAKAICKSYQAAIVSTSANIEGQNPAKNTTEITKYFPNNIDYILPGEVGDLDKPTPIYDIISDKNLRD